MGAIKRAEPRSRLKQKWVKKIKHNSFEYTKYTHVSALAKTIDEHSIFFYKRSFTVDFCNVFVSTRSRIWQFCFEFYCLILSFNITNLFFLSYSKSANEEQKMQKSLLLNLNLNLIFSESILHALRNVCPRWIVYCQCSVCECVLYFQSDSLILSLCVCSFHLHDGFYWNASQMPNITISRHNENNEMKQTRLILIMNKEMN